MLWGRWIGNGHRMKILELRFEIIGDLHRFRSGERADGVDELATRFHRGRCIRQEIFLNRTEFRHVLSVVVQRACGLRCQVPTPLQGASTNTPSNFVLVGSLAATVPEHGPVIESARPSGSPFQFLQPPCRAIAGPDQSFVLHQIGKVQEFAAFARAGVPPGFARLRLTDKSHGLGADILHFEFTGMELRRAKQIFAAEVFQGFGHRAAKRTAISKLSRQCVPLPSPGAQPKLWLLLQRPEPFLADLNFLLTPSGDYLGTQVFLRKCLRSFLKSFRQLANPAQPGFNIAFLSHPAIPPKVSEHEMTDLSASKDGRSRQRLKVSRKT